MNKRVKYAFYRNCLSVFIGIVSCGALFLSSPTFAANDAPKAVWYRYYDQHGIANISTSVTPAHIRHGYEALDQNMQVIKRSHPYNSETDLNQSSQRALSARYREEDNKLKKAYSNSKTAVIKRDQALLAIKKQMNYQQEQLNHLQQDKILFKRQEMEYFRKGEKVPERLKALIENNLTNILKVKQTLELLSKNYNHTNNEYENIIERLKKLE
ncbi:hypothetical protein IC789_16660 [Acinetobacter seifertii]|uniref:Uncharacterized protein n=2 Tax=Acinetobacter seifertii TaxID=1530123 RepID=A0A7H2TVZ7_9GAMM|nr:hypothetical protein [Acinetobacter seifertii]MBD1231126.1 hypothetical protein [Acinetobacter seifertii]QNX12870.1 hypothetical protein IC794_03320 [Acinetobacter seifertii]QNX19195.1 hypothetical protein IC792_16435 [Acinetobacter seifertii]QNX25802.1 hypothetical protein IC791_16135 [Acinetobacter seifertii]QNX30887.1 hypothetical protein IC790_03340 [Acinetobacter seifertii]